MVDNLASVYVDMKQVIIKAGFSSEIDWQENIVFEKVTEQDFIREAAWVILSAGMSQKVVSKVFCPISEAFFSWISADLICRNASVCKKKSLIIFRNERKISAIIKFVQIIQKTGCEAFRKQIECYGVEYIKTLPFMGPATSHHYAKNIGLNIAKPDRHLSRIALKTQIDCPNQLCRIISDCVGDTVAVVDLVLWRFAAITPNYLEYFSTKS